MLRRSLAFVPLLALLVSPALAAPHPLQLRVHPAPPDEVVLLVREPAAGGPRADAAHPALESALARFTLVPARAGARSLRGGYSVHVLRSALPGFDARAVAAEL